MVIRRANWNDFPRVVELLRLVFPQDEEGYYFGFLRYDPLFHPQDVWVIERGGRVISCLWILKRLFTNGQRSLLAGGIANVATHPDFRGRGLASSLLEEVLQEARQMPFSFLILVTDIPGFYKRFGFKEEGKLRGFLEPKEGRGERISRISPWQVLEKYDEFYRRLDLWVPLRTLGYLRWMRFTNRFSSRFKEDHKVAFFGEAGNAGGYFLERKEYIEVFDLFSSEDPEGMRKNLESLGKPVRLFHHPRVLEMLGIKGEREGETVMVLPLSASLDLYFPPADYF